MMKSHWGLLLILLRSAPLAGQDDSVTVRFTDAELRTVVQALGRYLDRPLLLGAVPGVRVTFETPTPIPRAGVRDLLAGLAAAHDLDLVEGEGFFRLVARTPPAARPPASGTPGGPLDLHVLRLRHARAPDVAATIGRLFGVQGGDGSRGFANGTLSEELRRSQQPTDAATPAAPARSATGASLQGAVTIVADEVTNALLVRAGQQDFEVIQHAVEQLDVRPPQVLIEVLIVEARRDRLFSVGVDLAVEAANLGGGATLDGSLSGGGLGSIVLQIMGLSSLDIEGMIRLAVSRGDARIVSRPVLLAANNREARILVGSQRPFVSVSRSLPTDSPSRDQVVQYRDVGTKLTVLPTINADGWVSLLIRQEVNSATNETQFDAPIISTREAETQVLVRDGQTIVLGGLRERQTELVRSGIPLLSDLPLIGGLFGFQERRTTETELFLFITPRVLTDDDGVARVTDDARRAAGDLPKEPRQ